MRFKLVLIITVLLFVLTACEQPDDTPEEKDTNLYTTYTDGLEMDFTYEGKDFFTDGVGVATLVRCVDGDTAFFSTGSNSFSVRFLGIDTPESTSRIDPWGKSASDYTCDKLTNATTIVLEQGDELQDNYDRYLAWVWYDGRLLNLELVEQAYSNAKGVVGTQYEDEIYSAELKAQETDRRVWGEIDPDYDYSLDGIQLTVGELVENMDDYIGKKIVITGVVAFEVGGHPYITDDSGYGIYMYLKENSYKIEPGNEITISGLDLTFYPSQEEGSPQLVGIYKRNVTLVSEGNEVSPRLVDIADLVYMDLGSFVEVENVTVTEIYQSPNTGDYTITCEDSEGNEIGLHITGIIDELNVESVLSIGDVIDVAGGLSRYDGQYQLEMSDLDTVEQK